MPVVRLPDDSLGIQSADGKVLPWALGEKRLADMGLEVPPPRAGLTDASRGATAEFKASDYKGPGTFKNLVHHGFLSSSCW